MFTLTFFLRFGHSTVSDVFEGRARWNLIDHFFE